MYRIGAEPVQGKERADTVKDVFGTVLDCYQWCLPRRAHRFKTPFELRFRAIAIPSILGVLSLNC
jgi:hypothetical protein